MAAASSRPWTAEPPAAASGGALLGLLEAGGADAAAFKAQCRKIYLERGFVHLPLLVGTSSVDAMGEHAPSNLPHHSSTIAAEGLRAVTVAECMGCVDSGATVRKNDAFCI